MLVKHERLPLRFGMILLAGLLCLPLMGCKDEKTAAHQAVTPMHTAG